ncbi:MAG: hypothetical protein ABIQ05_05195 [Candidatus Limnocylindria bacterium]
MLEVDAFPNQARHSGLSGDMLVPPLPVGFGEGFAQQVGVGIDQRQLAEDCGLQLLAAQTVLVTGGSTMPRAGGAGVVVVAAGAVVGGGAHQRAAAAVTHQAQPAEQEGARVAAPLGRGAGTGGPQALGRLEQIGIDDGRMAAGVPRPAEGNLAAVDPIAKHAEDGGARPALAAAGAQAALIEPGGDRAAA